MTTDKIDKICKAYLSKNKNVVEEVLPLKIIDKQSIATQTKINLKIFSEQMELFLMKLFRQYAYNYKANTVIP